MRVRGGERPKPQMRSLGCPARKDLAKLCATWERLGMGWDELRGRCSRSLLGPHPPALPHPLAPILERLFRMCPNDPLPPPSPLGASVPFASLSPAAEGQHEAWCTG